jgi:hypothetical protein
VTKSGETIIGKWELVEIRGGGLGDRKHEPRGYVEYLADGRFGWYDYTTKEYTLFDESKYWIDRTHVVPRVNQPDIVTTFEDPYWVLHYGTTLIELDDERVIRGGPDFPDKGAGFSFQLKFIDQNTKSLFVLDLITGVPMSTAIYKRIK